MLAVLFWILFSLVLLTTIPDRWHARREIANRQRERTERITRDGRAERGHPERGWKDA